MNNNEPAAEHYSINGFKYFSELAKEYFPDLANASSASKKMRKRIKADKTLNEQLAAAYYTCQTIDISPEMQLILYRHWGDRKSTRLNSSHASKSRMPSSA